MYAHVCTYANYVIKELCSLMYAHVACWPNLVTCMCMHVRMYEGNVLSLMVTIITLSSHDPSRQTYNHH